MKFHGVDVQGYLKIREYTDTEPVFNSNTDERKLIYVNDTVNHEDSLYIGGVQGIDWVRIATYISGGTTLEGYYSDTQCDGKFLESLNADVRDVDLWTKGIVFDDWMGSSFIDPSATLARVADNAGSYSFTDGNNNVVKRNDDGDIFANIGNLTATNAEYADLAEKYTCDESLVVGTVVGVDVNSPYEVSPFDLGMTRAIGVVSDNPAYLMNKNSEGLPIALTGKVPIMVVGPVSKGDDLVPCGVGLAHRIKPESININNRFAVALETNLSLGEHLIMCIIK